MIRPCTVLNHPTPCVHDYFQVAKNYAAVYAGTSAALDTLGTNPTQADVVSANMLTVRPYRNGFPS